MGYTRRKEWQQHYADGKSFRQLGEAERALLAEHAPAPDGGGQALDVGCGTGELAAYLVSLGYVVDAIDFAASATATPKKITRATMFFGSAIVIRGHFSKRYPMPGTVMRCRGWEGSLSSLRLSWAM
ncbi:class I SAM-dependent methyltransferase [Streptomyces sp. CB03238]|uniref:class I SAM-dependent methyltransferase n=1 Tax=Streptomyces sp. CB03238 TaxID=1907777 RepID=UPI0015C433CB